MRPILLLALLGIAGCANIVGLDGYYDAVDGAAEAAPDGSADATADAMPDALADVVHTDGGTDASDASSCVPTGPENCSDGLDNDCNGQTDCTDPACTAGYTCVPPLPNGWTWTAYDQGARPSCATGYTTPTDVDEGLVAPAATCGCGCTTTSPTCATGNLTITAGTFGVNGCQDKANQMETAAGGCQTLSVTINANNWKINAKGPAPAGGSCSPTPAVSKPAVSYTYLGRTCAFAGNVGAGCGGGDVCAPKAAPYTMCVVQTGDVVCPAGFPAKHSTGSVVADTRDCSACTCAFSQGACGGTLTLYTDNICTQSAAPVTVNGTCQLVVNHGYKDYVYAPQSSASCTGSAVAPTGSAAFTDLKTVCCVN